MVLRRSMKVRNELQKAALVGKGKAPGVDPGYVFIEIGDLIMWLVKRNHGLEQVVADAVANVARNQFLQLTGVAYA